MPGTHCQASESCRTTVLPAAQFKWTKIDMSNTMTPEDQLSVRCIDDQSMDWTGLPAERSQSGTWKSSPFIFVLHFGDAVASISVASNLVPYMLLSLHQSSQKASTTYTNFMGALYMVPLVWGFLADSYLGRYRTLGLSSLVLIWGMLVLSMSTSLESLKPPPCVPSLPCRPAQGKSMAVFYAGLYMICIGSGGIKPCTPSFGGDQFDDCHLEEKRERPLFFNLLFLSLQLGSLVVLTLIIYVQDNVSTTVGFGIPGAVFLGCVVFFFLGTPIYRYKKPAGSGVTRIAQVVCAATRKRSEPFPDHHHRLFVIPDKYLTSDVRRRQLPHTTSFRFLDRAAIVTEASTIHLRDEGIMPISPWKLCPVTQVEEVKQVLRIVPIWITSVIPYCLLAQVSSYTVVQTLSLDRHIGSFTIPHATFSIFTVITAAIILLLFNPVLVPLTRLVSGNPRGITTLQRMGIGMVTSVFAMVAASVVEVKRKAIAAATVGQQLESPTMLLPMSAFWLIPQVSILGITEAFFLVGQMEFFYDEMPDKMRSTGEAFFCAAMGVGYFLTSFLTTLVCQLTRTGSHQGWLPLNINQGNLENFYGLLAVISIANTFFFLIAARSYQYKRTREVPAPAPARRLAPQYTTAHHPAV